MEVKKNRSKESARIYLHGSLFYMDIQVGSSFWGVICCLENLVRSFEFAFPFLRQKLELFRI